MCLFGNRNISRLRVWKARRKLTPLSLQAYFRFVASPHSTRYRPKYSLISLPGAETQIYFNPETFSGFSPRGRPHFREQCLESLLSICHPYFAGGAVSSSVGILWFSQLLLTWTQLFIRELLKVKTITQQDVLYNFFHVIQIMTRHFKETVCVETTAFSRVPQGSLVLYPSDAGLLWFLIVENSQDLLLFFLYFFFNLEDKLSISYMRIK